MQLEMSDQKQLGMQLGMQLGSSSQSASPRYSPNGGRDSMGRVSLAPWTPREAVDGKEQFRKSRDQKGHHGHTLTAAEERKMKSFEGLDTNICHNELYRQQHLNLNKVRAN